MDYPLLKWIDLFLLSEINNSSEARLYNFVAQNGFSFQVAIIVHNPLYTFVL